MEKIITSLEELETEARNFVSRLFPKDSGATLVTFSGELGAGKTAFTKLIAKTLGVEEHVTSPTFVLEKIYLLPKELGRGFTRLAHIDAYRLKDGSDLAALGFDELMSDRETLVILEWPEQVSDMHAPVAVNVTLQLQADGSRKIIYG